MGCLMLQKMLDQSRSVINADIGQTLSELGTSVKIDGPDQEVEIQKQEEANKPPVEINQQKMVV